MKTNSLIVCLLVTFSLNAQNRTKIWYFGTNAGIDFNSGSAVALTNGQINTYEGVASICDTSGALQFYTDGSTVYDRNHATMPNGTGLLGGGSSSQSAMIIPEPGNDSMYYIFCAGDGGGGFSYSKLNMNLNGGDGDIDPAIKNIILLSPITEKLTACVAQNGVDIWVMVHEWMTDAFYGYLVTPSGVSAPVVTNIGLVHNPVPNQIGCMKFSHDARKLAVAVTYMSSAELFEFDNATGIVSNPITFTGIEDPYGVEFSPDNTKLYFSARAPYTTKALYQYDLNAGNAAAITASRAYVYRDSTIGADNGSLQLAPDGKIYLAHDGSSFLEVINDPDQPAATCGYVMNGFDLSPQSSQQGLPNYITTWFSSIQFNNTCLGDSTNFEITATGGLFGAQWDFDDPASAPNNTAFSYNPSHLFSAAGTYQVLVIQYFNNGAIDSSYIEVIISAMPLINLGTDSTLCLGDTLHLNAGGGYTAYSWQDGSFDSTFAAVASGTYWVKVSQNTCVGTDTIVLNFNPCNVPSVNLSSTDTVFCEKKCLDFFDLSTNSPVSWLWLFPGADSVSSTQQNPTGICYNSYGSFDVTLIACNASGCDTLFLPAFIVEYPAPAPVLTLSNDTLYSSPGYSYQWWNSGGIIPGATGPYFVTTFGESYYVFITDSLGCSGSSGIFAINGMSEMHDQPYSIVPNPNSGTFELLFDHAARNVSVRIYNMLSQQQDYKMHEITAVKYSIQMYQQPAGIYFIEITNGDSIYYQRFIKQ